MDNILKVIGKSESAIITLCGQDGKILYDKEDLCIMNGFCD